MNIFLFSFCVAVCAEHHCCKHLVKMANEIVQLLVTAISETEFGGSPLPEGCLGPECDPIPKPTHKNHPMAIAVRKYPEFFLWAAHLGLALCARYTAVFSLPGKPPKVRAHYEHLLRALQARGLKNPSDQPFADDSVLAPVNLAGRAIHVPLCMDTECVVHDAAGVPDAVESYRNYFTAKKQDLARWFLDETPYWYTGPVLPPTKAELKRRALRSAVLKTKTKNANKADRQRAIDAIVREIRSKYV